MCSKGHPSYGEEDGEEVVYDKALVALAVEHGPVRQKPVPWRQETPALKIGTVAGSCNFDPQVVGH